MKIIHEKMKNIAFLFGKLLVMDCFANTRNEIEIGNLKVTLSHPNT